MVPHEPLLRGTPPAQQLVASRPAKPAFGLTGPGTEQGLVLAADLTASLAARDRLTPVHLRMPSIDAGVRAFIWSVVFFLLIWIGGAAVGVASATAFILGLVVAFFGFFVIRVRGD